MRSTLFVILAVALTCVSCRQQEATQKSHHEVTLSELSKLKEKYAARLQKQRDEVAAAESTEAAREIFKEFSTDWQKAVEEMLAIAESQPSTTVGQQAAIWIMRSCDSGYDPHVRAANLLLTYHATDEELSKICASSDGFQPVYEKLLRTIASTSDSSEARGNATFQLAALLALRADNREAMDATPELREERIRNRGEKTNAYLESTNPERDRDEAKQLFKLVLRKFPDLPYRGSTLGDVAAARLMPLEQTYPELGKPAPKIEAQDLDGNRVSLESLRGKVVVVAFWASWCGACLDRIPEENQLLERYQDADFALWGVNGDEALADAQRAVREHKIRFSSWWNDPAAEDSIVTQWGVTGWPTIFVLDQSGVIRYKNLIGKHLHHAIDTLLESDRSAKK